MSLSLLVSDISRVKVFVSVIRLNDVSLNPGSGVDLYNPVSLNGEPADVNNRIPANS
jgi:hypothetical protein